MPNETENPFDLLPMPAPGDPILADHFRALAQSLLAIREVSNLAGQLLGREFGEARAVLQSAQFEISRVVGVFGREYEEADEVDLDVRRVLQIAPVELGARRLAVVVSEDSPAEPAVFAPNLIDLTYDEALERMRSVMGEAAVIGPAMVVPGLISLTPKEAIEQLSS